MSKYFSVILVVLSNLACSALVHDPSDQESEFDASTENSSDTLSSGNLTDNSDVSSETFTDSSSVSDSEIVGTSSESDTTSIVSTESQTDIVETDSETTTYPDCDPSCGPCCDETGHFRDNSYICNSNARYTTCVKVCGTAAIFYDAEFRCSGSSAKCVPDLIAGNVTIFKEVGQFSCNKKPGFKCSDSSGTVFLNELYDNNGVYEEGAVVEKVCQYYVDTTSTNLDCSSL